MYVEKSITIMLLCFSIALEVLQMEVLLSLRSLTTSIIRSIYIGWKNFKTQSFYF